MLSVLEKVKEKAKSDRDILAVLVFGSSAFGNSGRDIDLCLVPVKKLSNLAASKKRVAYQKISDKLDVHILDQLPLYVRKEVISHNQPLIIKNEDILTEKARLVIKDYGFFEKHYEGYLRSMKDGTGKKASVED